MHILLSVLIVTAAARAATDEHGLPAVEVFRCDFGDGADANFDHWPDGWKRKRGPGYPPFTQIKIVDDSAAAAGPCLQITLDGGAAAVFSPPIPAGPLFSYRLQCDVRGERLAENKPQLSLTFLDAERRPQETHYSKPMGYGAGWSRMKLWPCAPKSPEARYAVIGLHLGPGSGADLHGSALFDNLSLSRASRVSAALNHADHIYIDPSEPEVECTISGQFAQTPRLRFELIDVEGRIVAKAEQQAAAVAPNLGVRRQPDADADDSAIFTGLGSWKPSIPGPGFYRVRVSLIGEEDSRQELSLAVVSQNLPSESEFGWSLAADPPLSFAELADLAPLAGIRWLKLPVWYDRADATRGDQLAELVDRLSATGVQTVGVLTDPPPAVAEKLNSRDVDASYDFAADQAQAPSAATVFSATPDVWADSLEPVLTRLALKIHWWQLGSDGDRSFAGHSDLDTSLARVKKHIAQFGQEPRIGLGWRNTKEPAAVHPKCNFVVLPSGDASGSLTRQQSAAAASPKRWVLIDPFPRDAALLETRAGDLVHRLTKAKVEGADAIFAVAPFDTARGLMNDDGSAGELFLPWRTTALALGGAQHLGSIQLPYGSANQVFARGDDAVMVVWNAQETFETLRLGSDLQQADVWGRVQPVEIAGRQRCRVAGLPTFVTGLNASAARWQIGLTLSKTRLPSMLGVPQETSVRFQNHFAHPVSGSLRVAVPDHWRVDREHAAFTLGPGAAAEIPLAITLPLDALSGPQVVRIDFDISADRRYEFSVYRQIEIGSDDIALSAISRTSGNGDLEIIQTLTNRTDEPLSFKFHLFAPGRKRQSSQIMNHGRGDIARMYRLENAAELSGKTLWLRAEEVGGARVLNHRITVPESF